MVAEVCIVSCYFMKQAVGDSGSLSKIDGFLTEILYIDWLVTTPLLLIKIPVLLGLKEGKGRIVDETRHRRHHHDHRWLHQ